MTTTPEVVGEVQPETEPVKQTQQPPSEPDKALRFSIGDVMEKAGIPRNIREKLKAEKSEEGPEEVPTPEPAEEVPETPEEKEPEEQEPVKGEEKEKVGEVEEEEPLEAETPQNKKLLKRIDKITALRRQAEEKAAQAEEKATQLEAQLADATPVVIPPSYNNPLSTVTTPAQLDQVYNEAKFARDTIRRMLAGPDVEVDEQGKGIIHIDAKGNKTTREEAIEQLGRSEDMINEYIPQRNKFLEVKAKWDSVAYTAFPDLFKRGSADFNAAGQILRETPEILNNPKRNYMMGVFLFGEKVLKQIADNAGRNGAAANKPVVDKRITAPQPPIVDEVVKRPSRSVAPFSERGLAEAKQNLVKAGGSQRALKEVVKNVLANRAKKGRAPASV